jgi:flavin reductase (DIM6/NTAB) family NADH-FMN oxidoreductase RutF
VADSTAAPSPGPSDVDVAEFRRAVGRFVTGVCVVSTFAGAQDHAMTANAFTSVSLDPLLVLVCVEQDSRFLDAVLDSGVWGVSVLDERGRGTAEWLATPGRPLVGQLDPVPHHRGRATGVALVDTSLATLECRTTAAHTAGDHVIVVGEVLDVGLAADGHGPLVYHRSSYRALR